MLLSVKLSVFSRQRMKTCSTGQQQGELAAQHQGFNIRGVNTDQRWFFLHCKLTTRFVLLYQNLSSCRSPDSGDTHSVTTGLTRTKRRDLGYKTPSQQAGVSKNPKANDRYHPTTQPPCTYPACFCPYLSVVIPYCSSPCPRVLPSPPFPCPPGEGHLLQTPCAPELPACSQGSCDALAASSCPWAAAQNVCN